MKLAGQALAVFVFTWAVLVLDYRFIYGYTVTATMVWGTALSSALVSPALVWLVRRKRRRGPS